ncbi:hypothetical protein LJ656_01295 [Paraburkholderia sp. MMS20-SJTR3]|uniref:CdiI immunity protein domain-containing protein n=1 Tax=Paraburkholderia sejongensis TaxID=2886946 RepID=A0ABS8JN73_9BURK|nr:contact-dependent growth inhibition system immunity protein [Paraburkholderia sp. MMS20-SJTR3]MCC8391209.1 hypothetical protein [Paraburkholderia sp. MMS20-SJTR3]
MSPEQYSQMEQIFGAYFGEDFDLFGDTIPEIISCYKNTNPRHYHHQLIDEINLFLHDHPNDLDAAFEKEYGSGFDPKLWGHTTISFLSELTRLLSE